MRDVRMPKIDPVSGLKLVGSNRQPHTHLLRRGARQCKTAGGEDVLHKAGAVDTAGGVASPVVGNAEIAVGFADEALRIALKIGSGGMRPGVGAIQRRKRLNLRGDDLILQKMDLALRQPAHRVVRHQDSVPVAGLILDRDIGSCRSRRQFAGTGAAHAKDRCTGRQLSEATNHAIGLLASRRHCEAAEAGPGGAGRLASQLPRRLDRCGFLRRALRGSLLDGGLRGRQIERQRVVRMGGANR